MMAVMGLSLIVLAWLLQFYFMNKQKKIYASFIIFYIFGVALLVYDGFSSGLNNLAITNLVSLIVSLAVLIKLKYY